VKLIVVLVTKNGQDAENWPKLEVAVTPVGYSLVLAVAKYEQYRGAAEAAPLQSLRH
jgi:hypothetical protein